MSLRRTELGLTAVALLALTIVPAGVRAAWPWTRATEQRALVAIEIDRATGALTAREASDSELEALRQSDDQHVRAAFRLDKSSGRIDPVDAGLSWYWLAFGFGAQLLFTARMLAQWVASERAKASVVPVSFWVLSVAGAVMLLAYFLRRGDPVGVTGQAFGLVVYARNLVFIRRGAASAVARTPAPASPP